MTITYPRLYPTCNHTRFALGVPLEDIFPYGDIHPSLKKLIAETFNALCICTLPIKHVLRYDTPWPDNILLEKALLRCEQIDYMHPGTLLWMLRHFLGSLPLPLLPKYTDNNTFIWLTISERCRYALERYAKDRKTNEHLINVLAEELLRLPSVNLLLIGYLINFMRSLVVYPGKEMSFNKNSTLALAKYFTPSIFIRPFHKKRRPKAEQLYRPLMLYLLIKWPEIQLKCMEKHPQCFVPIENRTHRLDLKTPLPTIQRESIYTQTIQPLDTIEENQIQESEISSSDSFVTLPEADFLRDVSCQTDSSYTQTCHSTQTSLIGLTKRNITRDYPYQFINFDLLDGKYFRYGDYNINYPKTCKTQASTQINKVNSSNVSSQTFISNQEYIYDDYEDVNLLSPNSVVDDSVKDFEVVEEESIWKHETTGDSKKTVANDLTVRCSQIGWTYTPPINKSTGDAVEVNNYKICYSNPNTPLDTTTRENEELASSTNVNDKDFAADTSVVTPLNPTKSKRSILSFSKFRDKIDFLKIFKDRKITGSSSVEHIRSNIKYQKIDTVKSTTF